MGCVRRAIPPEAFRAHFYTDRTYSPGESLVWHGGKLIPALDVHVVAGAVGGVMFSVGPRGNATLVTFSLGPRVLFYSGYVNGKGATQDTPEYTQEAAAIHALRVLREWLRALDQAPLHFIDLRAGDAITLYRIRT